MRKAPRSPSPVTRTAGTLIRDERTYRFLTPVFGGGVRVDGHFKPADPRTPVRVPSIRGQLRFWWRACNPARCTSSEDLARRETAIFGSTTQPSRLGIVVVAEPRPASDFPVLKGRFDAVDNRVGLAYGAFPLRAKEGEHGVLHEHPGDWSVLFTYPEDLRSDVEAALWAWAHFGGLGGRTRRGFGAIAEIGRSQGKTLSIEAGYAEYVSGVNAPWSRLPKPARLAIGRRRATGVEAQEYLLSALRRLRQGEIGRKGTADDVRGNHPGRSYWPEPDTIRKLTGARSPSHARPVTAVDAFPRAVFGMPIIFEFKGRKEGDPPKTMLLPRAAGVTKSRLASPLILRPHRAVDGSIEPLALVLAHPEPAGLVLVDERRRERPAGAWKLTPAQAATLGLHGRRSPLVAGGVTYHDPIDRFLKEIQ